MEFLDALDTQSPLGSNFSSKPESLASDAASDVLETNAKCPVPFTYGTKQPRDMLECFLEITGYRPSRSLKRYTRMATAMAFMKEYLLRNKPKPASDLPKIDLTRRKAQKPDVDFVRRPILVEKHSSSDEEALPSDARPRTSGRRRSQKPPRGSVTLVTERRARYRERRAREKRRIEDTKKQFEEMAEAEAEEKRRSHLGEQRVPTIRPTRGSLLRDQRVLLQEAIKRGEQVEEKRTMKRRRTKKRRDCALRTRASTAPPMPSLVTCSDRRFSSRRCNPWLDHDAEDGALESPPEDGDGDDDAGKRQSKFGAPPAYTGGTSSKQRPRTRQATAFWRERLVPLRVNGGGSLPPFK